MVGATLGGGVGRYNGLHGLLLDSLLSVKMVTAVGDLVTASTEENPDLFWGIRGAGFNFGTILEATYSVYNETAPQVLNVDFLFASNASQGILEYFKTFESSLPAELSFILLAAYSSDFGGVSSFAVNRGLVLLHWLRMCIPFSHRFLSTQSTPVLKQRVRTICTRFLTCLPSKTTLP